MGRFVTFFVGLEGRGGLFEGGGWGQAFLAFLLAAAVVVMLSVRSIGLLLLFLLLLLLLLGFGRLSDLGCAAALRFFRASSSFLRDIASRARAWEVAAAETAMRFFLSIAIGGGGGLGVAVGATRRRFGRG